MLDWYKSIRSWVCRTNPQGYSTQAGTGDAWQLVDSTSWWFSWFHQEVGWFPTHLYQVCWIQTHFGVGLHSPRSSKLIGLGRLQRDFLLLCRRLTPGGKGLLQNQVSESLFCRRITKRYLCRVRQKSPCFRQIGSETEEADSARSSAHVPWRRWKESNYGV